MSSVSEKLLEDEITTCLVAAGGYHAGKIGIDPGVRQEFDAQLGFDTTELFAFIELTQGTEWAKLVKAHGGAEDRARQRFTRRLAQQIDERGTVDVLRHGVRDQNVEIRLSYRKPAFGVAPELVAHYDANRLTVTRQVLNDRFGTDLTDVDKLLLDQFEESWVADRDLADQAQNNSLDNFRLVFDKRFLQTIITRVDANDEIFKKILDDEDFRATLGEFYLRKVYDRLQATSPPAPASGQ